MGFLCDALGAFAQVAPPPIDCLGPVDHLGIKVSDLEPVWEQLAPLGLTCASVSDHPEVGLRIAFLDGGVVPIELLCVISPRSPLAADADGLHHVAYRVAGLRVLFGALEHDSRFAFHGPIRRGARGHEIATFRLRAAPGLAYELVEEC
ncbi:MAG: VOC family protein [Deltaproteobacteria bacterium]|nr:VOC family protein [Deltaproteobacteria bacterium]